jgi:hypothetical protein
MLIIFGESTRMVGLMKDEESIGYEDGQLPSKGPPAHLVKAPIRVSNHSN